MSAGAVEHDKGCPAAKDMPRGLWVCTCAPPSQRAELLTQEQLGAAIFNAYRPVTAKVDHGATIDKLVGHITALTQRVSTLTEAQVNAVCHAVCDQCVRIDEPDKPPCTTENCAAMRAAHEALAAYRALPKEPR